MSEKKIETSESPAEAADKAFAEMSIAERRTHLEGKKLGEMTDEEQQFYLNDEVVVTLFKDADRYKDDLFVGLNGVGLNIKRGEPVKIKRKFARVIEESQIMDVQTSNAIIKAVEQFEKDTAANI